MTLLRTDLNLFVVFEAIYSKGTLTRAAQALNVTQPAVSNALARLRRHFGDPLFVSTGQGMMPTPRAQRMIGTVREALLLLHSSAIGGMAYCPASSRRLFRLSMSEEVEALLLPGLCAQLQPEPSGALIQTCVVARHELVEGLSTARIDVAIDAPSLAGSSLSHLSLLKEAYACLLRPGHPFQGDTLSLEDYLQLGHVAVSRQSDVATPVDAALHRRGVQRAVRIQVQHHRAAPLIVQGSDWALTAPNRLLQSMPGRLFELPFFVPPLELHLYWHRSADEDGANRWLRQALGRVAERTGRCEVDGTP